MFGFFSGPLFATVSRASPLWPLAHLPASGFQVPDKTQADHPPKAISVGAALFPAKINATAISFVFVFAQIGGSLFPIVTGVLGVHVGVSVMQPILVGLLVATTISWLLVPQPKGKTK